jgi:uncharacterized repeat protein (TIGR01451 family)
MFVHIYTDIYVQAYTYICLMSTHLQWIVQTSNFNTSSNNSQPVIINDAFGNLYVTYYTNGTASHQTNYGLSDIVIFKLEPLQGQCLWVKQQPLFNTSLNDWSPSITIDSSSNLYLTYYTTGISSVQTNTGQTDIVVAKFDSDGTLNWIQQQPSFNTTTYESYPKIATNGSTAIYVTYVTTGTVSGQTLTGTSDIVVCKFDTTLGHLLWITQQPTFNSSLVNTQPSITVDGSGYIDISYTTTGTTSGQTNVGLSDLVVFQLEPTSGQCVWITQQPSFDTSNNETQSSIVVDQSRNIYIGYTTQGTTSGQTLVGGQDIVLTKFEPLQGTCLWVQQQPSFDTIASDSTPCLAINNDSHVLYLSFVTQGVTSGQTLTGSDDIAIGQFNLSTGQCQWIAQQPTFNTNGLNLFPSIVTDTGGNIYCAYQTDSIASGQTLTGTTDVVVVKLSPPVPAITIESYTGVITGSGIVRPDRIIDYTVTVRNTGDFPLTNVVMVDNFSNTINIGNLALNQQSIVNPSYIITQSDINTGSVDSQVSVEGTYLTTNVTDYKATSVPIEQVALIDLSKTTNSVDNFVGGTIQYNLVVINTGNVALTTVHLVDTKLGLDLTQALLDPTNTLTQIQNYLITQADFDLYRVDNTAIVTALDPHLQEVSDEAVVATILCVIHGTLITMANGQQYPIQEIKRGDLVAPNHRVARVCHISVDTKQMVNLVTFQPNSLGCGKPTHQLTMTDNHPLIYDHARRPAKCFVQFNDVTKMKCDHITDLYDLQFDHDGTYLANGIEIQSCSPHSASKPLPKNLYFDSSLYTNEIVWDNYDQTLPLVTTLPSTL